MERGWASKLMLGHDYAPAPVLAGATPAPRTAPTTYTFLNRVAIPALLESGVSQADIDLMAREVPRKFLEG